MKTLSVILCALVSSTASASWIIDWSESDARRDRNTVRYAEAIKVCKAIPDEVKAAQCIKDADAAIAKEERARTLRRI